MSLRVSETQVHDSARTVHTRSCAVEMASELSQLIESELRKAEGANKPDEHQRRLASLRVKTGLERPPTTLFQRVCTTKRQIIAGGVVTAFLLILIIYAAASHRHHTTSSGSILGQSGTGKSVASGLTPKAAGAENDNYQTIQSPQHTSNSVTPSQVAGLTESPVTESPLTAQYTVTHESIEDATPDSQQTQAEGAQHKQSLNATNASSQAMAPAPSADRHKAAPALAPAATQGPRQNATAVPAPAPS